MAPLRQSSGEDNKRLVGGRVPRNFPDLDPVIATKKYLFRSIIGFAVARSGHLL
jgi:hypothetical protein